MAGPQAHRRGGTPGIERHGVLTPRALVRRRTGTPALHRPRVTIIGGMSGPSRCGGTGSALADAAHGTPTDHLGPHVAQVNVSAGGVPKRPVPSAFVTRLGLRGDEHRDRTVHGGPFRAVCLYSMEAIERVRSEGHPIAPGSVGENLTLRGLELSSLQPGDRLAIGDGPVLEVTTPADPCDTIRGSFLDGKIGRISIRTHPLDARLYARVLVEGTVHAGDPVSVLPPLAESDLPAHLLLDRIDTNERAAMLLSWRSAIAGGIDVRVIDDGELAMAATPSVPADAFNVALGLRRIPHLLPDVLSFFAIHGVAGWVMAAEPPWPGAVAIQTESVLAARPDEVLDAPPVHGLRIRRVEPREAPAWERTVVDGFGFEGAVADAWNAAAPALARDPRMHLFLAEVEGVPAGAGGLFVHRGVGGLGPGAVLPAFRGRGVHAALIAERTRSAAALGCDLVAASARLDGPSERNMARMGLRRVWTRHLYRRDLPGPEAGGETAIT